MTRTHRAIAAIVCVLVPLASYALGSRRFAWPMFSGSESYKLRIIGRDHSAAFFVAPTDLAAGAGESAAMFFAGADHFRHAADADIVRGHLDQVAAHACRSVPRAVEIEVVLVVRASDEAPAIEYRSKASCGR